MYPLQPMFKSVSARTVLGTSAGVLLLLVILFLPILTADAQSATLATVGLTPGWATFGQPLPQGAATSLVLKNPAGQPVSTQVDVKNRWPDNSIKFAILTANIASAGNYTVVAGPRVYGSISPANPPLRAVFALADGSVLTATLPHTLSSDVWLDGPLVKETRSVVTPTAANGSPGSGPAAYLRVIFDTRNYSDGKSRVDVTVENVINIEAGAPVTYAVDIIGPGDQTLYHHDSFAHHYRTRWRKVLAVNGFSQSADVPDTASYERTGVIPHYDAARMTVPADPATSYDTSGPDWDIMGRGYWLKGMESTGGRPEIGLFTGPTASYLAQKLSEQRAYMQAECNLRGSWPIHLKKDPGGLSSDGATPTIDECADKLWDSTPSILLSNTPSGSPLGPDTAHTPENGLLCYYFTGDRFSMEEGTAWATYGLFAANNRSYTLGLFDDEQVRAMAWQMRNSAHAALMQPDTSPLQSYFREKVQNNLRWMDGYAIQTLADTAENPLGFAFPIANGKEKISSGGEYVFLSLFMMSYVSWTLDHLAMLGYQGGQLMQDRLARNFSLLYGSDPDFPFRAQFYHPWIGSMGSDRAITMAQSAAELRELLAPQPGAEVPYHYALDYIFPIYAAFRNGLPHSDVAFPFVYAQAKHFTDPTTAIDVVQSFGSIPRVEPYVPTATSYRIDFGRYDSPVASGFTRCNEEQVFSLGIGYGWAASVAIFPRYLARSAADSGGDPLLNDRVNILKRSWFYASLKPGGYDVTLTFGGSGAPSGAGEIYANTSLVDTRTATAKGPTTATVFRVTVSDNVPLRITFVPLSAAAMTLSSMTILPASGGNLPPTVSAGRDQTVAGLAAELLGTASDDGQPGALTTTWSSLSGPGTVTFTNASALTTTATFSAPGKYVLRLTASDSVLSRTDDVAITVSGGSAPSRPLNLRLSEHNV